MIFVCVDTVGSFRKEVNIVSDDTGNARK